jgi:hypothetical protein
MERDHKQERIEYAEHMVEQYFKRFECADCGAEMTTQEHESNLNTIAVHGPIAYRCKTCWDTWGIAFARAKGWIK